ADSSNTTATHAIPTSSETRRNDECTRWPPVFAATDDQSSPELARITVCSAHDTPTSRPPMNRNGAIVASASFTRVPMLFAAGFPVVVSDLPAKIPATIVPIHPPLAVIAVHG